MTNKTIKISDDLHSKLKDHCDKKNLKLNGFCEMLIESGFAYEREYDLNHPRLDKSATKSKILLLDSVKPEVLT